jgi:hypothetical protein
MAGAAKTSLICALWWSPHFCSLMTASLSASTSAVRRSSSLAVCSACTAASISATLCPALEGSLQEHGRCHNMRLWGMEGSCIM